MSVGDKLKACKDESRRLKNAINQEQDGSKRRQLIEHRAHVDSKTDSLVWEALNSQEELFSDPVVVDSGVSAFVIRLLNQVKSEVELELKRDDLYPNIRDQLFKRRRALGDVIRLFYGDRRENRLAEGDTTELLLAEFGDDSIDFAEADDAAEADEITERMVESGGVVTRYTVVPYGGSSVVVHSPLREMDNFYEELPPDILNRVFQAARGRVRLPEGFVVPPIPDELLEYLRMVEGD